MRRLIYSIIFIQMAFSLTSCDKFVQVPLPDSQLTGEAVFANEATVEAAIAGLYAKIRDRGLISGGLTGSGYLLGLYGDEFDLSLSMNHELYQNSLTPASSYNSESWNACYNHIFDANTIMEGVQSSTALGQNAKSRILGEALFVRALTHFFLVNLFGDVPYVETTSYTINSKLSRMPVATVYEKIVADLVKSESLLGEDYISPGRVRPNKFTVTALLARVYLYMGRWQEAAQAASRVINSPLYKWETDLNKVFLKDCQASIWQLDPGGEGANTMEGTIYVAVTAPPIQISLTTELVDAFSPDDLRRQAWIGSVSNGTNTFFFPYKYKKRLPTGTTQEVSIIFRLAEQYLIRAEAYARIENLDDAKSDLNLIRATAGLNNTIAVTKDEILTAILNERRLELFSEGGHRFYDLKRFNLLNETLSKVKPGWDSKDTLWPLPGVELSVNPNLNPQNPGY